LDGCKKPNGDQSRLMHPDDNVPAIIARELAEKRHADRTACVLRASLSGRM
jgi:hypothetical protein